MNKTSAIIALEELKANLPQFCFTLAEAKTEPINLIFVGRERALLQHFSAAGWKQADHISPLSLAKALFAGIFNLRYSTWPVTPYKVNGQIQKFSFQKELGNGNYRGRHHLRIWLTAFPTTLNEPIWVCAASAETGIKLHYYPLFVTHRINPDLDFERDFVVAELVKTKASLVGSIDLSGAHEGKNFFNDPYRTDGQAAVLEVS